MPDPLRSYRCTGRVTPHGTSYELLNRQTDAAYIDISKHHLTDLQFSFRYNRVEAGHLTLNIDDLPAWTEQGQPPQQLRGEADGELAIHDDDPMEGAWFEENLFTYLFQRVGTSDDAGLSFEAPVFDTGGVELYFTPSQTKDFLDIVARLRDDNPLPKEGELVLANGDTITDDLAPA